MMKKSPLNTIHNYRIDGEEFENIYNMIKVLDLDKKKRIKGVSSARADILPSALAAINSFMKYMNFEQMVISGCGLREGIMFNYAMPSTIEKPITDVLTYSLQTLVKYHNCNAKHCEQVANLSVQLFKQLRVLHKFPRQCLKILKVAACLHDAGTSIKYYDYQKHSSYVILNSSLYGITQREIVLVALVVASYKNDDFAMQELVRWKEFISEEDVEIIRKLGVILRIAESLDRSMSGNVIGIDCDVLGDSVIAKTQLEAESTLEIKEALSAKQDFKRVFKKNLEIL
jgi:exopolyphosphatase/guanosine-5'-triphosphate,3'-diphosphate pyrophosphatase